MTRTVVTLALLGAYTLVAALPLMLAWLGGVATRPGLQDLGSALGMVGLSMLLVEFLLSGRFRLLSTATGMDALMRFHQAMAWVLLALLTLHPYAYGVFPRETGLVAGQPVPAPPDGALGGITGFLAWIGLAALVTMGAIRDSLPIRYETWRLSHGLGALAIALLALAHTLLIGHFAASPLVSGFWLLATLIAALSLVQVYLVKPWRRRRRPWRVASIRRLAAGIHDLELAPLDHDGLRYRAGQFVWLNLTGSAFGVTEHPFSIASAPSDGPNLRFIVKANGDFTDRIGDIPVGRRAYVDGPFGDFTMSDGDANGFLFVAGGVGLAPVLGLLRALAAAAEKRPIRLVVANADSDEIVLGEELTALGERLDLGITRVVDAADRPAGARAGPVSAETLRALLPGEDVTRWRAYMCAPPGMIDAVEPMLLGLGIPSSRIHSERFRYRYGLRSPTARRTVLAQGIVLALLFTAMTAFLLYSA